MREIEAVLSVFHDGQFFVAVAEVREEGGCRAARHVFGAEPSPRQVYEFVLHEYAALRFGKAVPGCGGLAPDAGSPKRRQREAAKVRQQAEPSTQAQAALAAQREAGAREARHHRAERGQQREAARFALRVRKRKEKHRGH